MSTPAILPAAPAHPPLWPHQSLGIKYALERPGTLFDVGMGGGKGRMAITVAETLQARCVLVLCPKSVANVWGNEITLWSDRKWHTWTGEVQGARGPLINPSVARRAEAAVQAHTGALKLGRPFLAVVNYDAAWQGDLANWTLGCPFDFIILDESHRAKSPKGKTSRHAARCAHRVRGRGGKALLMTGTPMPHTELDIWAQTLAVDSGQRFGTNYHKFCQTFSEPETFRVPGGKERVRYTRIRDDRRDDFTGLLSEFVYRVPQKDLDEALGLEEPADVYRTVKLGADSRRAYDAMEKDLIAEIHGSTSVAANAMVLTTKLAQLSGGFTKTADGQIVYASNPPEKAQLLTDILQDVPATSPVVVFARFHADLDAIAAAAVKAGRRYGELSGRRRDAIDHRSKAAPGVQVLGVQPKAGGVGIDLTAARVAVFYSLGFELADYLQARKRVHRPGQAHRVTYLHLVAEDTIDFALYGALKKREDAITHALNLISQRTPS